MKTLTIDIETSPNLGWVFDLWQQNVGLSQVERFTEVICFAAKWRGEDETMFFSSFADGKAEMVGNAFALLDEADAVVHFNGKAFDMKHLNREILLAMPGQMPSPYGQIDLYQVARSNFRFASNKLDHIANQLGLGGKFKHRGFELWRQCMLGDPKAWEEMEKYNRRDVVITEQVYDRFLPWIKAHPHHGLYTETAGEVCRNCGSDDLKKQGFARTESGRYQRYQCRTCGKWLRGGKRIDGVDIR